MNQALTPRIAGPTRRDDQPHLSPNTQRGLSLHGSDPTTGIPATWHVTSLADDGAADGYLIERAEGDIHSPALWMQARRDASVVGEAEVVELVRAVMFGP